MSERSHDVPKGASHRGTWIDNVLPIDVKIGTVRIKAKLLAHYQRGYYTCTHDGITSDGPTLNRAAMYWVIDKIAFDIERGGRQG